MTYNAQAHYTRLCQITDNLIDTFEHNDDDYLCFASIKLILDGLKGQSGDIFEFALLQIENSLLEDAFEGTKPYDDWINSVDYGKYMAPFLINPPKSRYGYDA